MTVRLGVIGCGRAASLAIGRAAADVPDVEIIVIASRDPERARAFAVQHQLTARVVASEDLLESEIDALYIGTPDEQHEPWGLRALAAGKGILVEKPLALDAAAGARLAQAAGPELAVVEGMMLQHHPWSVRLSELCAAAPRICRLHTTIWFSIPPERRRGRVLEDVAPYWLWLVSLATSLDVTSIRVDEHGDDLEVELVLGSNILATLHASHSRPYRATHRIEHDGGTIELPDLFRANLGPQRLAIDHDGAREWVAGRSVFSHQLVAFARLCRDKASRAPLLAASLDRLRVVDAIRAAWTPGTAPVRIRP